MMASLREEPAPDRARRCFDYEGLGRRKTRHCRYDIQKCTSKGI